MKIRASVLAAGLLIAATASVSHAAPAKKVCNLIKDVKGDATASAMPGNSSQDLVGGDVASDAKQLTAVLRVDKIINPDPEAPLGQSYFLVFTVKGFADSLFVSVGLYPTGNEFKYGWQGPDPNTGVNTSYTLGDAKGVIDTKKNELRVTAPFSAWKAQVKLAKGGQIRSMTAEARRVYGQRLVPSQEVNGVRVPIGGVTLTFDTATGKTYTLGAPSCVAVGK